MKQLEIEYKNAVSSDLPDLWSRIEAGVDEYEKSRKNANIVAINNEIEERKTEAEEKVKKANKNDRNKVIIYARNIFAAAACLILAIGAMNLMRGAEKTSAPMAETADSAMAQATSDQYDGMMNGMAATAEEECESADEADFEAYDYAKSDSAEETTHSYNADKKATFRSELATQEADITVDASMAGATVQTLEDILGCDEAYAAQLKLQLRVTGISSPDQFVPVDVTALQDKTGQSVADRIMAEYGDDVHAVGFTDLDTGSRYIMYCDRQEADDAGLILVMRDDDTAEVVYERDKDAK